MASYKLGRLVPAVALTLKMKSGTIISNIPAPILFDKVKLVSAEIIQLICINKQPAKYIDKPNKFTSSYTFEEIPSGNILYNQYPEAIPYAIGRWHRFSFVREGNNFATYNYVDLFRYLSALRTSIARIRYYDELKIKARKDKSVPSLLKTRLAIYEALCAQAANQLNVKINERRIMDDTGVYRPTEWKVTASRL